MKITSNNGQSQQQRWSDRYECHRWAAQQSNFDPTHAPAGMAPAEISMHRDEYRRAMSACMEGKGYTVQYGAAAGPAGSAAAGAAATNTPATAPAMKRQDGYTRRPYASTYHPLRFQVEGGYSAGVGDFGNYFNDGSNVGVGLTLFPVESVPVGLRVDASYSRFWPHDDDYYDYYSDGIHGHENIYGGDVDLQFNLPTPFWNSHFYLLGGAGWYREQLDLRQVSLQPGTYCGFYNCGPGLVPVVTGEYRATSPWRTSWNAGLGWEVSFSDHASLFVEARYQRIAPQSDQVQMVPIRVGLRF